MNDAGVADLDCSRPNRDAATACTLTGIKRLAILLHDKMLMVCEVRILPG